MNVVALFVYNDHIFTSKNKATSPNFIYCTFPGFRGTFHISREWLPMQLHLPTGRGGVSRATSNSIFFLSRYKYLIFSVFVTVKMGIAA